MIKYGPFSEKRVDQIQHQIVEMLSLHSSDVKRITHLVVPEALLCIVESVLRCSRPEVSFQRLGNARAEIIWSFTIPPFAYMNFYCQAMEFMNGIFLNDDDREEILDEAKNIAQPLSQSSEEEEEPDE